MARTNPYEVYAFPNQPTTDRVMDKCELRVLDTQFTLSIVVQFVFLSFVGKIRSGRKQHWKITDITIYQITQSPLPLKKRNTWFASLWLTRCGLVFDSNLITFTSKAKNTYSRDTENAKRFRQVRWFTFYIGSSRWSFTWSEQFI